MSNRELLPILDLETALAYTAGDRQLLRELGICFLQEEGPQQLNDIHCCIQSHDVAGARQAAHKLIGSLGIFGAAKATAAAVDLESATDQDEQTRVAAAWETLHREMRALFSEVQRLCDE